MNVIVSKRALNVISGFLRARERKSNINLSILTVLAFPKVSAVRKTDPHLLLASEHFR